MERIHWRDARHAPDRAGAAPLSQYTMTTLELIHAHPFLTGFVISVGFGTLFHCWNRLLRTLNIRNAGWPPDHCDADGSVKE